MPVSPPDYRTHDPRGWCGDPKRGAALGRPTIHLDATERPTFAGRLYLKRIPLNAGGYDVNGTYFGVGKPLYWLASTEGTVDCMLRADSRENARNQALKLYPRAKIRK